MFLLAIVAFAALALALKALVDARRVRDDLARLSEKFAMLDHRLFRLAEQVTQLAPPSAGEAAPAVEPATAVPPEPAVVAEEPAAPAAPAAVSVASTAPQPAAPIPAATPDWERLLVEHWLVWLGGAALALGGAFLVKLSIDYGLLVPAVRVALGVLLGIGLSAAAEWVRRREMPEDDHPGLPSYVPQALAAAGAATVFAALYAGYQLYGLIPAAFAFPLLAATAIATVAMSLRHGAFVAALGLVGAYAVPGLVTSEAPHALPLFAYLAMVTAGSLALLRHRAWWWLAWLTLAGAMLWVPLWLAGAEDPEVPVVAGYSLVLFGLFVAFRRGIARVAFLAGTADTPLVRVVARSAFWAIAAGLLLLAHADRFGMTSIAAATAAMIGLMALAYRDDRLDDVVAVSGALALALLASWNLALPVPEMSLWVFRVEPDHVANFTTAAIVFTLLLGAGGFAVLPRVARPGRWAALSAAAPLAILIIAYWRLQKFDLPIAWTLTALVLAGVELAAAAAVARRRTGAAESEIVLAAYAVGVLGSTTTAAAFGLGEAWLTVTLAVHLPALGWVDGRIRLKPLRWVALAIAAAVLVRLVLNPYVLQYPLGPTPIVNWLLYGYGVPAAAFIIATRQFGSRADDALVWTLEAGSALFLLFLLSLELIHAIYGRLTNPFPDFAAGAALIALWLAYGARLLALGERRQRPVLRWGGGQLVAMASVVAIVWQFIMLLFGAPVGRPVIFDALLLADAVPALIYAAIAWRGLAPPALRMAARILAAAFAFAWVTLEIRHVFHGNVWLFRPSGEAEWYVYSVAWLAFAGIGLAFGLVRRNEWLRRAGLIGIGLVIGKVFLSDMAELGGVLRALSFLGLGGALVLLGYAYRRLRPLQQP